MFALKILLIVVNAFTFELQLRPFNTDGCSVSPNGIPKYQNQVWVDCCIEHDKKYWVGGTEEERLIADVELRECITNKGFNKIAVLYFKAVRTGGGPDLPTTYRWGYGWNCLRPYGPITEQETLLIAKTFMLNQGYNNSENLQVENKLSFNKLYEANLKTCPR